MNHVNNETGFSSRRHYSFLSAIKKSLPQVTNEEQNRCPQFVEKCIYIVILYHKKKRKKKTLKQH